MRSLGATLAGIAAALLALSALNGRRRLDLGEPGEVARAPDAGLVSRLGRTRFVRLITGWDRRGEEIAHGRDLARTSAVCFLAGVAIVLVAIVTAPPLAVAAPVVMRVPSIIASRAATARRRDADREIPQMLDLLAAASTAGMAAPLALRRCVEPLRGPLAEEIRTTVRAIDLGGRWSEEVSALAVRLDLSDLKRAATLITRTETLGSSLTDSVSDLADQVRSERRAKRAERARAAPVKMLFPLVFLVLPAFLLLTVVPVFLTTLRSI